MFNKIFSWRFLMVVIALYIVAYSIYFTNQLARNIANEETNRIKTYALALESVSNATTSQDISFQLEIIADNKSIPIILTDNIGNVIDYRNVSKPSKDSTQEEKKMPDEELKKLIEDYKKLHQPIKIQLPKPQYVFYGESIVLHQLRFFPYILFAIIVIFMAIVFIAYNNANQSMQNRVWVGMSKETAHQLGTPLMSMIGWLEYLRSNGQENIANEMEKDVDRLKLIADRFGKIGSKPVLTEEDIVQRLQGVVEYMQHRCPKNVKIILDTNNETDVPIMLNGPLFDWVIENLIRNSLDAMQNQGKISIQLKNHPAEVEINLTDTGKGIAPNQIKKVFKPGFTTKKRGWGLGLSLAKRIITKYHYGAISVVKSELNVGTTFKIILKR